MVLKVFMGMMRLEVIIRHLPMMRMEIIIRHLPMMILISQTKLATSLKKSKTILL